MVSVRVLAFAVVLGVLAVCEAQQRSPLDSIDIDAVFKNDRLLKLYMDCLLDKRPCSREGADLKKRIPKILENNCANCTPETTSRAVKVIRLLSTTRPQYWKEVKAKYDPTGEHSIDFGRRHNLSL